MCRIAGDGFVSLAEDWFLPLTEDGYVSLTEDWFVPLASWRRVCAVSGLQIYANYLKTNAFLEAYERICVIYLKID